jgi:hypothetical protein
MSEVQMPEANKILQCTPFHDSRALPYFANSLILQANKKYYSHVKETVWALTARDTMYSLYTELVNPYLLFSLNVALYFQGFHT